MRKIKRESLRWRIVRRIWFDKSSKVVRIPKKTACACYESRSYKTVIRLDGNIHVKKANCGSHDLLQLAFFVGTKEGEKWLRRH